MSEERCAQTTLTSTMSHWPVVPSVLSPWSFLVSLRVTCGDPPDCCSLRFAVCVAFSDRFMAQGKKSLSSHNGSGAPRSLNIARGSVVVTTMAAVSVAQQQHQQFIDRISGLEARMAVLQTHAEAQQERIRVAEIVIQQLQANPTNPTPPLRDAFQKQVTEGGALKALTKNTGKHSEYRDWCFSARRALTRADDRFAGLLQWISGEIDEVNEIDVLEYRKTWTGTTRNSTRCWPSRHLTRRGHPSSHQKQWKEVKGIIGWQRLEREARGRQ